MLSIFQVKAGDLVDGPAPRCGIGPVQKLEVQDGAAVVLGGRMFVTSRDFELLARRTEGFA